MQGGFYKIWTNKIGDDNEIKSETGQMKFKILFEIESYCTSFPRCVRGVHIWTRARVFGTCALTSARGERA